MGTSIGRGRRKLALIGGGQIGGILALLATQRQLGDIVIVDIPEVENPIKGKAIDLMALRPHAAHDVEITATADYAAIAGADVALITAGVPRRPGMTRDDLLKINQSIIEQVAAGVAKHAPNAFCVLTTNPLDAMVYAFHRYSGLPAQQIAGMAGALDSNRFRTFVAMKLGCSVADVSGLVMGGHGPSMIPITRTATVGGVPLRELMDENDLAEVVQRTRNAGTEVVQLLGRGSAFYSPAAAVLDMAESCLLDRKRVLPCAVQCTGQYGIHDLFIGVPCVIGAGGVERILEFELTQDERNQLDETLAAVGKAVAETGL